MIGTTWAILPPLLTFATAIIFKRIYWALGLGILCCVLLLPAGISWEVLQETISDLGHLQVILFSLAIGAMVQVLIAGGSLKQLIKKLERHVHSKRRAELLMYGLGFVVFFDDYANTMVVGNSMQKLADRYGISRAKLAYLVDSTAAPVASIGLVSTWIGFELGEIQKGLLLIPNNSESAYSVFLASLEFAFYPILTLVFIFLMLVFQKDFGPMKKSVPIDFPKSVEEDHGESHWVWSVLSIGVLIIGTFAIIYITGHEPKKGFVEAIQNGNSYLGLVVGSLLSLGVAVLGSIKINSKIILPAIVEGGKHIGGAIAVLLLAWLLGAYISALELGSVSGKALFDFSISTEWIPILVFVGAGVIAFATGSSWSTMSLFFPVTFDVLSGLDGVSSVVLYASSASVLSGAVLGDHCSPISDTTILSSMASGCNHLEHVRTQTPYALFVGGISLVCLLLTTVFSVGSAFVSVAFIGLISLFFSVLKKD